MGNFFAGLKRRYIYRAAAAHALVAWLLLQVFNNLTPVLKLRDWAGAPVLVIGCFPVALIFAWILHLASADSAAGKKSGATDWVLGRRAGNRGSP